MCLNCGCMAAHDDMGKPKVNITYEDIKQAAEANDMTVEETLAMIASTAEEDRRAGKRVSRRGWWPPPSRKWA